MPITYYLVCRITPELRERYFIPNLDEASRAVESYLAENVFREKPPSGSFKVAGLPSKIDFDSKVAVERIAIEGDELVIAITILDETKLSEVLATIAEQKDISGGVDLPIAIAEHWCPRDALGPEFGSRDAAEALINVPYIRDTKKLRGKDVNVVVVDQGIDAYLIQNQLGGDYGGGWSVQTSAGTATHGTIASPHGMMIARNILKVAPEARLFDLPLVPHRIGDPGVYLSDANAAFIKMLKGIRESRQVDESWVVVNPWAVFDRRYERPAGSYTNNPNHVFNRSVRQAVSENIDMVFCAGNCGQFCPDKRCGPLDQGPGESILGANSLDEVLTVGAVRSDTIWLGYSSQGPGKFASRKPDLCAPTQFREIDDYSQVNEGTSAATAMAAGLVAALRSGWNSTKVSPKKLIKILNATARKVGSGPWNERYGHGIIDAKQAVKALSKPRGRAS